MQLMKAKLLRMENNLTLMELQELTGVKVGQIRRLELDPQTAIRTQYRYIKQLSDYYNVSVDDLTKEVELNELQSNS